MRQAVPAAIASPDDWGDGKVGCNRGEICFSYQYGGNTTTRIRHFYDDAEHKYTTFSDGSRLVDNAGGFRNLDTRCIVYYWDRNASGQWFVYGWSPTHAGQFPGGTTNYLSFQPTDRDRNNGHTRCDGTTPPEGR